MDEERESTLVSDDGEVITADITDTSELEDTSSDPGGKPSWLYPALGAIIVIFILQYLTALVGQRFFWSPRTVYVISFVIRTLFMIGAGYLWHRRVFWEDRTAMYAVFGSIGFISGLGIAIARFMNGVTVWTFLNIFVEPIDSALLSLFAVYLVSYLTMHNQLTTQRT